MTMQNPDDLVRADEEQRRRREADEARRAAGQSLYTARGWNPEAVAAERRTAERLGIAPILVQADPVGAQQRAQSQADLILLDDSPATARWIAQPENARLAHDRVESLTWMERLANTMRAGGPTSATGFFAPGGLGGGLRDLGRRGAGGAIGAVGYTLEGLAALQSMNPGSSAAQRMGGHYLADRVRLGGRAVEGNLTAEEQEQIRALGLRSRVGASQTDTGFAGDVAAGVGQIGGQLTLGAATGGLISMPALFAQGAGQMGQRVQEDQALDGRTEYSAADAAAILGGGLITAGSERVGLSAILGRLPAPVRARLTNKVADVIAAGGVEAFSEVVEGVGHNALAGWLLGEEGGLLDGTLQEGSTAAVVGSLVRALTLTAIPGRQYVERQDKARADAARLQSFEALGERVMEEPLFKRAPDRMEAFLESVNPEAMVHLPAEVVATFFQSNPDLDGWLDEWDIRDQLEQASAGGAEIVIPASAYLTRIRPTAAHEAFRPHLRQGFDDLSEVEIAAETETGEARLDEAMTEAETLADQAEAEAAPFDRVVADAFSQLRAAGRSIDVARREALVEGVRARTRAARSPEAYADAWAAYQAEPLTIQRGEVARRARANMDRADVFIAALKAGRGVDRQARMAGPSLMEFVSQEGGIADTGGELAAMGANEWHKGKSFRRRLVRDGDEGTYGSDYVTERAIAAGYLPEGSTGNDLLEAFREELAGRPRFSSMADRNLTAEENEAALQDFEQMLAELGLNAKTDSVEDIKAALEAASNDGTIYDQSGALVTDSPAFRAWFGDSKVVDENGEPLVVYHGTAAVEDFGSFKRRRGDIGIHFGTIGQANDRIAFKGLRGEELSGDRLLPVYLSIKKPLRLPDVGAWDYDNLTGPVVAAGAATASEVRAAKTLSGLRSLLERKGFDGVVYRNTGEAEGTADLVAEERRLFREAQAATGSKNSFTREAQEHPAYQAYKAAYDRRWAHHQAAAEDSWIAFRPEQIKSVFNRGTFDANDPRILHQISPEAALALDYETRIPTDPLFAEAIENTPGATLTDDGLVMDLVRFQKPGMGGDIAVRTGVFYLPTGSNYARYYKSGPNSESYGGSVRVEGQTLIRAPLFVKGQTGGKAPEVAYDKLKGKGATAKMASEVFSAINQRGWMNRQGDASVFVEMVGNLLEEHGADRGMAADIIRNSTKGSQLRYALQENIIAHAVREAGYDSVVGYSKGKAGPFLTEVFDVREDAYPTPEGGFSISPTFYQSQPAPPFYSALAAAVSASQTKRAPADQWKATLAKTPGVKKEEIEWVGVNDWLDMQDGPVSREALAEFLAGNGVRVDEVVLGEEGWTYQDLGYEIELSDEGDEWVLTRDGDEVERFPDFDRAERYARAETYEESSKTQFSDWKLPGADDTYREVLLTLPGLPGPSTHWDTENVVAHARLTMRKDAEGKSVLFIEEVQSDWHQKGRDQGYSVPPSEAEIAEARAVNRAAQDAERAAGEAVVEAMSRPTLRGYFNEAKSRRGVRVDAPHGMVPFSALADAAAYAARLVPGGAVADEALALADTYRTASLAAEEARQRVRLAESPAGVPDAPFRTSWPALVMKRMIRYAVDQGADRIAWTTGEQQADRYDLAEQTGPIWSERRGDDVLVRMKGPAENAILNAGKGRPYTSGGGGLWMTRAELTEVLGNELGGRVYDGATEEGQSIPAEDVKVGGEGMRAFYDRNLVNITNDIVKRYGAKVGRATLAMSDAASIEYERSQISQLEVLEPLNEAERAELERLKAEQIAAMDAGDQARRGALAREIGPLIMRSTRDRQLAEHRDRLSRMLADQPSFDITDQMREAAGRGFTLFQGMTGPRGSIQPGDSHLITLMATADKSTFLHEAGHRYLFGLFNDAAREGASEQIKGDARAVLAWMNVNDASEVTRELHEKWAETFEQYLMEGRAPSVELRSAFQRFAAWLKDIYDGVRRRLPNAAINDDIRGVMDRLLATDGEIEEAKAASGVGQGIASAELAGMTEEAFAEYAALANKALDQAHDTLLRETMRAIRREKTAEWKALADEFRPEIEADVDSMLDLQAMAYLRRNPMSRELVVAMLGNEAGLALLPKGVPPIVTANGMHPDMVAEAAGYPSGTAMLNGLMEYQAEREQRVAEGMKGTVRAARIEERVRDKMLEHYGDPFTDGSIQEEALAAIHNDTQGKVLAAELGIIARRAGQTPSPYAVLRQWAARHIGSRPIGEAKPQRFLRAERTAAGAAMRALAARNNAEAFRQKQAQTVNFLLYGEARKAKRDVESAIKRMARLGKKRTIKTMDQDYLDQIHALLRQYDLTAVPASEVSARASLLAWVNERDETGELVRPNVQIPSRLLEKAKLQHYSTLTVDEVRELNEAVQHLAKLGRLKKELVAGRERRELDAAAREARETGEKNLPVKPAREGMAAEETLAAKIINFLPNAEASLVRIQDYFRRLQGGDTGIFTDILDKPGQAAAAKMIALRRAFWEPIRAAERLIPDEVKVRWSERLTGHPLINPDTGEPLKDLIRQDLIGMAKHVGSASNFEKFAKGWGFVPRNADEFAVETARRSFVVWLDGQLHPTEWDYVQAWWNAHEGQREEYFDNERELTGIRPIPVEAAPVMIAGRTLPGGYAPISYDGRFDKAAAARDLADENDIFGGVTRVARTSNGAAQDRTGYVGPVNFGMRRAGADAHTQMVRIAYGKYVADALKFLGHPDVQAVIKSRLGFEVIGHLNAWVAGQVKDQAIPEQATRQLDGLIRGARANMMVGMMLLSSTVLMAQIGGLVQSTRTVGPKVLARGFALASGMAMRKGPLAPFRYVMEQSSYMRSRVEEASFDRDIRGAALQPASTATIGMLVAGKDVSAKRRAAVALQLATAARNNLAGAGGWLIGAVDLMLVSGPTWLGAYDMALTQGMSEADAIHYADSKVIQAQGGGRPIDTAPVMRGSEAVKTFTLAYGWASASYNLQREDVLNLRDGKDRSKAMVGLMGMFFAQPLIDALLSNDWPDWEDPQDVFAWFMRNVMFGIPNGIPGVRDIAGQLERRAAGKFAGDIGGTAMGRIFTTYAQLGDDLYRGAVDTALISAGFEVEDKEVSRRWPAHVLQALGYGFGIAGTVQASRIVSYTTDVADGEQQPAHMGDVLNGLARGPQDDQK